MVKRLAILFAVVALVYVAAFYGIEYLRGRKGAWEVTFRTGSAGEPAVVISEPKLGITNVTCAFPNERLIITNVDQTVTFDEPITNVPFGKVTYLDTTFLPGAVVLQLFGHEIQLLPRVLMIDRAERPWQSGMRITIPSP